MINIKEGDYMDFSLGGIVDGVKNLLTNLVQGIGNFFGGSQVSAGLSVGGGASGGYVAGGYEGGIGGYGGPPLRPLGMVGGRSIGTPVAMGAHFSKAAAGIGYGASGIAMGYDGIRASHGRASQFGVRIGI